VQLDAELLRYRRQRALGKAHYAPRSGSQRQDARLHLIPVAALPESLASIDRAAMAGFHPTATVEPLATITAVPPGETTNPSSELKQLAQQYASQVVETSDQAAIVNHSPDDYLESSEELLRTLSLEEAEVDAEQSFIQTLLTPLGVGSLLLLLMSSALFGFVVMNPSSITQLLAHRDSSSIPGATDPAKTTGVTTPQPNLANQEFPELSLGHLGAIPAQAETPRSSSSAQAKLKTPSRSVHLGRSGVATKSSAETAKLAPEASTAPQIQESAPAASAGDVPSPRRLTPAPPENSPPARDYTPPARKRDHSPSPKSYEPSPARDYTPPARKSYNPPPARDYTPPANSYEPEPARRSYNPPPPAIQPYSPPAAKPVVPVPKVKPSPLAPDDRIPLPPEAPAVSRVSPGSGASGYKVVAPYTSDRSLEDYRGKVPDAYVKNYSDGAKVQFGAYQDETAAKSQVEELRKQGIPAEVYKP